MNQEIKELWLEYLDSGKFKRGLGKLRGTGLNPDTLVEDDKERHCCLGVLGHVLVDKYPDIYSYNQDENNFYFSDHTDVHCYGSMPLSVINDFDITPEEQRKLIDLNDVDNYNFKQISKWIKENL